jgi:hypothetical protein
MNRRQFLQSASTAALISIWQPLREAGAAVRGNTPTARSVINVNFLSVPDYQFIDHVKQADQFGPSQSFAATPHTWPQLIDNNGYPNLIEANDRVWSCGVRIPSSSRFAGPYVLSWDGDGEVFLSSGAWAIDTRQSRNFTVVNAARWKGSNARIVLIYSGDMLLFPLNVMRTGGSPRNAFLRNLRFYRLEDEADLLAGKTFRRPFKQTLVDLNPGAIRFMNWTGSNASQQCRFEHRTLPQYASYGSQSNWVASPRYGQTSGVNQYTLAAAAGTPAQMQHGELVTCRIGAAMQRGSSKQVSAITRANPGIATSVAHGFETGDVIVHRVTAGMPELNDRPMAVKVIDPDHYSTGVDCSGFAAFGAGTAQQYITLDVGGRGAYPVVFGDGTTPASLYGNYFAQRDYKSFSFDKHLIASTETTGAWVFDDLGSKGFDGGVPLEVCTALINELQEMTARGPIDMWITVPHRALLSMDPDHSPTSNWATNAVAVIMQGANGYRGLDRKCKLLIEYSNETWNFGGSAFCQTPMLARKGALRWPRSGTGNTASYSTLRAVVMVEDIRSAFPDEARLRFVLAGQGTLGVAGGNALRIYGDANFDRDPLNVWHNDPIDHFDYFAWAAYVYNDDSIPASRLQACLQAWLAAGGDPVAQEAACARYVAGIRSAGTQTIDQYYGKLLPAYAAAMAAKGKSTIMYEGGWDHAISGSADEVAFLIACKRSRAWADALVTAFDRVGSTAAAGLPADYIQLDRRWGHAFPDLYGKAGEGAGLDNAWHAMAARNRALP